MYFLSLSQHLLTIWARMFILLWQWVQPRFQESINLRWEGRRLETHHLPATEEALAGWGLFPAAAASLQEPKA